MADIAHTFGADLALSASGDVLATATPAQETQQRVIRRLLTARGGYVWHPRYGAGLPGFVGRPASATRIRAVIDRQMKLERGVGRSPAPRVAVDVQPTGVVTARVRYADLAGNPQTLTVQP